MAIDYWLLLVILNSLTEIQITNYYEQTLIHRIHSMDFSTIHKKILFVLYD